MLLWSLSDVEASAAAMEGLPPHQFNGVSLVEAKRTMKSPSLKIMALFMYWLYHSTCMLMEALHHNDGVQESKGDSDNR